MSSIFISISAYHDYELPKTMKSALEKSSGNHQINFGISHVYYEKNDIPTIDYEKAKYIFSKAPINTGVNVGRNVANSLYDGEDYFLQVDSHSRFFEGWDQALVDDILYYEAQGFKKPALTCYPASYRYSSDGIEIVDDYHEPQNIGIKDEARFKELLQVVNEGLVTGEIFQKSVSGGFIFTKGPLPKLTDKIAFCEEFPLGACMYTHGFDLLIPRSLPIFHYYSGPSPTDPLAHNRRNVWADPKFSDHLSGLLNSTSEEIIKMFEQGIYDEEHLGSERTLEEYGEYCGLDFKNRNFVKSHGVVYSFHVREDGLLNNFCYKQLRYSLSTLRQHNKDIPVKVFISPPEKADSSLFSEFNNVEIIPFHNTYPDTLHKQWVKDGYAEFLLHRWNNAFNALERYKFDSILYLDTDTVFHNNPEILFSKYSKTNTVSCKEDNSTRVLDAMNVKFSMNDGQFMLNKSELPHHAKLMSFTYDYVNSKMTNLLGKIDEESYDQMRWILIQIAATEYLLSSGVQVEIFETKDVMLHVEPEHNDTKDLVLHHYYSGNTSKFVPKDFL